jgi:hypothetical protein
MTASNRTLPSRRVRKSVSSRWVLLGLALSFALAFGIAFKLYQRYVAYEPIAARHMAPNAAFALRLDLEKIILYQPFREHLLPLILEGQGNPRLKPRLQRLRQHTRVEVGVDIRELVYSRGQSSDRWVVALGGMFAKNGVAAGMQRVLLEEGLASQFDAEAQRLTFSNGVSAGQAADGVVLFASDSSTLEAALSPQDQQRVLGLVTDKPLSLAARGRWLERQPAWRRHLGTGAEKRAPLTTLRASLTPGDPHRLTLQLGLGPGGHPELDRVQGWVRELARRFALIAPESVALKVYRPNELAAEIPVSPLHLDHAGQALEQILRAHAYSGR